MFSLTNLSGKAGLLVFLKDFEPGKRISQIGSNNIDSKDLPLHSIECNCQLSEFPNVTSSNNMQVHYIY